MSRWGNVTLILLFELIVPVILFTWLMSLGYSPTEAGVIPAALAIFGVLLLPLIWKERPRLVSEADFLPKKVGFGILLVFMLAMLGIIAFFAIWNQ